MKERPILFSGPMVSAILDGRKTQTRRIMKPAPVWDGQRKEHLWSCNAVRSMVSVEKELSEPDGWEGFAGSVCPYGAPGDRLWVREAHCIGISGLPNGMGIVPIKSEAIKPGMKVVYKQGANYGDDPPPWRPSIHMPRWASRLTLEITEIRVQRLQEISEQDAIAEGIERVGGAASCNPWKNYRLGKPGEMAMHCSCPTRSYMTLWESINGPGSWAANPWVWCVSFKRVQS